MPTTDEAKRMARALREALAGRKVAITHSEALELVAKSLDHADWNTFAARADAPAVREGDVRFGDAIPILRMFDVKKTKAFYVDRLGFQVDFEHRFEAGFPLYMQVSRPGLRLHLSEHNGDATPGSAVFIEMTGLDAFQAEIRARGSRAEVEEGPVPGMRVLQLWDPVSNRLRFAERRTDRPASTPEAHTVRA